MSNKIYVQVCAFVDYASVNTEEDTTYGYRILADDWQGYDNTFADLESAFDCCSEERIFELIWHNHYELWEDVEEAGGLYLNSNWIELSSQLHNYTLEHERLDSSDWNCQD